MRALVLSLVASLLSGCVSSLQNGVGVGARANSEEREIGLASNESIEGVGSVENLSLSVLVTRQLRPHWSAPRGAGASSLVTVLEWELNPDGSLSGEPRVVRQLGMTEINFEFAEAHAERAMRAVHRAQPFELPADQYARWHHLEWTFDQRF